MDAVRPFALIVSGALALALLVTWVSTRNPEPTARPSVIARGGIEGSRFASLLVDSEPTGATVWIDGDSVGVTPAWLSGVTPGLVEVVLRAGQVLYDTTLALKPGQDASVLIWLQPGSITQEPDLRIQDIPKRPGPTDSDPVVPSVEAGPSSEMSPAPARLPPSGRLQITTVPDGAYVWVSRERVGTTRLTLDDIPIGEQIVEVRAGGYAPERLRLDITEGALATRSITLRARRGLVTIVADAGSRVFINGMLEGTIQNNPLRLQLVAGRYEVRVFHPEKGEAFRVVEVGAGTSLRLTLDGLDSERGVERAPRRTGW